VVTCGAMTDPGAAGGAWRVDAHRHYWDPARGDYSWMPPEGPLARPYLPSSRGTGDAKAGIAASVVVQAAPTIEETRWLFRHADQEAAICGVVGWVDLDVADASRQITTIRHPRLVGVRPMIQDIPDDEWITRPQVVGNLAVVARAGLRFDALVCTRHLPHLIEAIRPLPDLIVVINHLAKPDYSAIDETWARSLRDLARRENTFMKISGMATEVPGAAQPQRFHDHVQFALETFGPSRCMAGSDWPVSTLALDFAGSCELLDELFRGLSPAEYRQVWRETSVRAYGLNLPDDRAAIPR
jgi:L-fucono-1,5-lactonase